MIIKMSSTSRAYLTNIDFNLWLFDRTFSLFPANKQHITTSDALPFQSNAFNDELDENNLQTKRY